MGDEVALGLSSGQFLSTVLNRLLGSLAGAAQWVMEVFERLGSGVTGRVFLALLFVLMSMAAAVPPAIQASLGFRSEDLLMLFWLWTVGCSMDEAPIFGLLLCGGLQLALWVDLLLVTLTVLLLSFALFGWLCNFLILRLFGTWSLTAALAAEFAIEPVPEGSHTFCNTGWSRDLAALQRQRPGLQHSEPYSSEAAQEALCRWIRSVLPPGARTSRI